MIPPDAITAFADRQKKLLVSSYNQAWTNGVQNYQPDEQEQEQRKRAVPVVPLATAVAGLAGAAALAVRKSYPYVAPTEPDPLRRAIALRPSFDSVNRMQAELATLSPADLSSQALSDLTDAHEAFSQSLTDWLSGNAWRLDAAESVAWAGEQNGYAEAADTDGQLLEWITEDDDHVCVDCQSLGSMPPQPREDWPTPGDGSTECNVGCRCSLDASERQVSPGDVYTPNLSDDQQATYNKMATAQNAALSASMPDAAYLE